MTRRWWLIAAAGAAACGSSPPLVLPESAGEWRKRGADREVTQVDITQEMHRLGLREARQADYTGPGGAAVRLLAFRMNASAAAFELVQKWRAEPGRFSFQAGDLFCEVRAERSPGELTAAASAFRRALDGAAR